MLAELQQVLVDCCTADDPLAAMAAARDAHPDLEPLLRHVDDDGLRLTALLVKKLRFERILRGDPDLQKEFEQDVPGFTLWFREYLAEVPPTAIFPQEEAQAFKEFRATR